MDDTETVKRILERVEEITKKPEKYVSLQEELAGQIESLTKIMYDYSKSKESRTKKQCSILENLIVNDFDEEQIWQEIELQNSAVCSYLVTDVARLLARNKLTFKTCGDKSVKHVVQNDCISNNIELKEPSSESEEKSDFEQMEKFKPAKKVNKPSIVDDQFFKLSEMEDFLNKMESENLSNSSDESVDFFTDSSTDPDNAMHYNDFFDQPNDQVVLKNQQKRKDFLSGLEEGIKKKKKVSFVNTKEESNLSEEIDENEMDGSEDIADEESEGYFDDVEKNEIDEGLNKSSYESRQERLKARISALEEEALKEKPWQLKGEVTAFKRPQNSLLEEYVEFDVASRPAPIITEKSTLKLEDVIRQRIKDKVWDDVVRKIKPVEDPKEYKKKLVLNQEKSKLSLSEIYEQEYLKEKRGKDKNEEIPDEESAEHVEIKKMMKTLFVKLDALSNFHFTPKQTAPEVKIISHLPAVAMEEVAPVSTSDAALLAPEEIKAKPKGDLLGKTERSATDKKRERRKKVLQQRWKKKEKEKREKVIEKLNPGMGNKYSKDKAKKLLDKVTREKNISQMDANGDGKHVKSSSIFFSKLQDEVETHVRKKVAEIKNVKNNKLDAKKIKL